MYVEDTHIEEALKYVPNWDHLYEIVNSFLSNIVKENEIEIYMRPLGFSMDIQVHYGQRCLYYLKKICGMILFLICVPSLQLKMYT